jgi:hypothetical protein
VVEFLVAILAHRFVYRRLRHAAHDNPVVFFFIFAFFGSNHALSATICLERRVGGPTARAAALSRFAFFQRKMDGVGR